MCPPKSPSKREHDVDIGHAVSTLIHGEMVIFKNRWLFQASDDDCAQNPETAQSRLDRFIYTASSSMHRLHRCTGGPTSTKNTDPGVAATIAVATVIAVHNSRSILHSSTMLARNGECEARGTEHGEGRGDVSIVPPLKKHTSRTIYRAPVLTVPWYFLGFWLFGFRTRAFVPLLERDTHRESTRVDGNSGRWRPW